MFSVIRYYKSKSEISYDDVFLTFFFKSSSVVTDYLTLVSML